MEAFLKASLQESKSRRQGLQALSLIRSIITKEDCSHEEYTANMPAERQGTEGRAERRRQFLRPRQGWDGHGRAREGGKKDGGCHPGQGEDSVPAADREGHRGGVPRLPRGNRGEGRRHLTERVLRPQDTDLPRRLRDPDAAREIRRVPDEAPRQVRARPRGHQLEGARALLLRMLREGDGRCHCRHPRSRHIAREGPGARGVDHRGSPEVQRGAGPRLVHRLPRCDLYTEETGLLRREIGRIRGDPRCPRRYAAGDEEGPGLPVRRYGEHGQMGRAALVPEGTGAEGSPPVRHGRPQRHARRDMPEVPRVPPPAVPRAL